VAEVRRAREVLEAEQRAVLVALRKVRSREERVRAREAERREAVLREIGDLLMRGREAGVPMVEMADALGLTRQMAHRIVRKRKEESDA
jgi:hypothetical protein